MIVINGATYTRYEIFIRLIAYFRYQTEQIMTYDLVRMIEIHISISYITFCFDRDPVCDICYATYVLFVYHVHVPLTVGAKVAKSDI